MLELRMFMIGASCCGISYNLLQPKPLLAPAAWGTFFVVGHAVQIYRLLRAKALVSLSPEDHHLYEHAFLRYGFSPRQFLELLAAVPPNRIKENGRNFVVRQGDSVTTVGFIIDGALAVECDGEVFVSHKICT